MFGRPKKKDLVRVDVTAVGPFDRGTPFLMRPELNMAQGCLARRLFPNSSLLRCVCVCVLAI